MRKAIVTKAFPYAADGINIEHQAVGASLSLADTAFDGLEKAGYVEAAKDDKPFPEEEQLNRDLISALDKRLGDASDQDLKDIIARSGAPYSGNMVHAHLVLAAKRQLLAEAQGAAPVLGLDPNSGVTEQPLAAPGQATPPSAASAVEKQQAQADAAKQTADENKATNQFDEPATGAERTGEIKLEEMTVAELKAHAAKNDIDLGEATKKPDILAAITRARK